MRFYKEFMSVRKYNTKVVLPKTKSELVKSINGLGQVEPMSWNPLIRLMLIC